MKIAGKLLNWTLALTCVSALGSLAPIFPYSCLTQQAPVILPTNKNTKLPEGATTAWLAGIGTLAIPGVDPFIAAGLIMAAPLAG